MWLCWGSGEGGGVTRVRGSGESRIRETRRWGGMGSWGAGQEFGGSGQLWGGNQERDTSREVDEVVGLESQAGLGSCVGRSGGAG